MDGISRFAEDWHVTALDATHCRVRWIMCMDPQGINRFMLKLFSPVMGLTFRHYLKKLARYAQEKLTDPKFAG